MSRGRRSRGRNVSGVLLVNKPINMTSSQANQKVRSIFFARKAGHTGTLDPLATGLLVVCLGEATKFSQFLLAADKTYEVTAKLGVTTTTGDAEGDVVEEKSVPQFSEKQLKKILESFTGDIEQIPSMYSALKHKGRPLYEYAREGIEVPREARTVHIYSIELTAITESSFSLRVRCSKGTYIRTLVEDIGKVMGCGAFVQTLSRTSIGDFDLGEAYTLEQLEALNEKRDGSLDKCLLPLEATVQHRPQIDLPESSAFFLRNGQAVRVNTNADHGFVRLTVANKRFIGVGELLDDGRVAPRRLVVS